MESYGSFSLLTDGHSKYNAVLLLLLHFVTIHFVTNKGVVIQMANGCFYSCSLYDV